MNNETKSPVSALYLYCGDRCFQMPTNKFNKLVKELKAGRGGEIITALCLNGYGEFMGFDGERYATDSMSLELLGF